MQQFDGMTIPRFAFFNNFEQNKNRAGVD